MKILTLTTQYANNYGALLQCYALSRILNERADIDCQVLQYLPEGYSKSWTFWPPVNDFRSLLKNIYSLIRVDLVLVRLRKQKLMRKFIAEYIPLTPAKYKRKKIIASPPIADCYICGSDQIWNFQFRIDFTFFFDFTYENKKCKRIAYAPSIAVPWSDEQSKMMKPYLEQFDYLSIRENSNLEQIKSLVPHKDIQIVADPVFLLGQSEWNKIAKIPPIQEPYIFCYFLSVPELAVQTVKKLRELTGYKVVHLNLNALDKFNSDYEIRVADPTDFVGLIRQANLICTNSFHCSAFSIIYKKNFCCIPKNMGNERIESLQQVFQLKDLFISEKCLATLSIADLTIDYSKGEASGKVFIEASKNYLFNAIYGK